MESIKVSHWAKVVWQSMGLSGAFCATACYIHFAQFSWLSIHCNHHCRNDSVAHFWSFLHVACNHVDGIPVALLNVCLTSQGLLDEEACVESLSICIIEVDTRKRIVVVEVHVRLKHFIGSLLKSKQSVWRVEGAFRWGWEVFVRPGWSIGISVSVVLVLEVLKSIGLVSSDLYQNA